MNSDRDPIVAIATAPGRGGIGIVRLSGRELTPVLQGVLGRSTLTPRRATLARFRDAAGQTIDEGIAILFPAPHSYTGETVLELQGHGGPVVLRLLLARCLEAGRDIGLRLAEPGEFTRRAFLNERLDLAQAEAVADLIDAATETAARMAARQLSGAFSQAVRALADGLTELRMLVEATLDFPEEEIEFLQAADALGRLTALREGLRALLARARQGARVREGLHVVLVGSPNVGKSSLLNALAGEDLAIVTPIAGTTRDRIAGAIEIEGVPLSIVDTAGLRATADEVERIGIARTLAEIGKADVVLHIVDATRPAQDAEVLAQVQAHAPRGVPVLTVVNKIDLTGAPAGESGSQIALSAKTGAGLDALRAALLRVAGWDSGAGEQAFLARERHLQALAAAEEHLVAAADHAQQGNRALELFAEELRLAAQHLGEITGAVTADDLLGQIFSRFCIGK
ncbi:MAG: tRNA uridine-5-carboxymethylaminomethyl(34) synthesis GTPase MnmE [Burkholderiaceae bacterium]|nr:tRNA uridine-5-carboxymethylaminomethyl(34) synthesis GTPase MnmE [Burkholderiaceae bacterium]